MDDTVKAATDALYEAIKAKVLKDIEECKARAKAEKATAEAVDEDREEEEVIDKFITSTFVRHPDAPDMSVRAMLEIFQLWCEQDEERIKWLTIMTNPINHISAHPWVQRQLYQDFKGLILPNQDWIDLLVENGEWKPSNN